jgi:hypothetical protein
MFYDDLDEKYQEIFTNLIKLCVNKLKNLNSSNFNLLKFVEDFNKILEIFKIQKILEEVKIYDEMKENEKYKNFSDFMIIQFEPEQNLRNSNNNNSSHSSNYKEKSHLNSSLVENSKLFSPGKKNNGFYLNSRSNSNNSDNLQIGNNLNPQIERTISSHQISENTHVNSHGLNSNLSQKNENKTVNNFQLTNNTVNIINNNTNPLNPQFSNDNFRNLLNLNQGYNNTMNLSSNNLNNLNNPYNSAFSNAYNMTNNFNNPLINNNILNSNTGNNQLLQLLYLQNLQNNPLFMSNINSGMNVGGLGNTGNLNNLNNSSLSGSNNTSWTDILKLYLLINVYNKNQNQIPTMNCNYYTLINMLSQLANQQNQINNLLPSNFNQIQENISKNNLNGFSTTQNNFCGPTIGQGPQGSNQYNSLSIFNDNPNSPISNLSSILMWNPSYMNEQSQGNSRENEKNSKNQEKNSLPVNYERKKVSYSSQPNLNKEFRISKDIEMMNKKRQRNSENSQYEKSNSSGTNKKNSLNFKKSKKFKRRSKKDLNYGDSLSPEDESENTSSLIDIPDSNFLESETIKKNSLKIELDLYKQTYEKDLATVLKQKEHQFMRNNYPNMYTIENFYLYIKLKNDKREINIKQLYSADIGEVKNCVFNSGELENKKKEEIINSNNKVFLKKLWNCEVLSNTEGKIFTNILIL